MTSEDAAAGTCSSEARDRRSVRWPSRSPAGKAQAIEDRIEESPWADHEYVRGYGAFVLPFSSGHLLALRVALQNSFGPYVSVWHRDPGGAWSIFVDGPSLEAACPRYWGPATRRTAFADIEVDWTGPSDIGVEVDEPRLSWTMSMSAPPILRAANAVTAALPLWTWTVGPLVRAREWVASRFLGVGDVQFSFTTPSGHDTVLVPSAEYVVHESAAVLEGRSLGEPVRLEENPTIGGVALPTRPSFVFAEAHMGVLDPDEYQRTRERVRDGSPANDAT
jgi:hypothetical protein